MFLNITLQVVSFFCTVFDNSVYNFSIDGTSSSRIAKYVNNSPEKTANCYMKKIIVDNNVRLVVCTKEGVDVKAGTELRYCYGGAAKDTWWRKKETMVSIHHYLTC